MIGRREFVFGTAGVLMQPRFGYANASQPATKVNFDVPADACDCHTHIHGEPAKFPWFARRTYTPETALPEEMTALHKALKLQRVVIVTPSVYGPDNSATIYGMAARGKGARGVAVIDATTTDAELDRLVDGRGDVRGLAVTAEAVHARSGREIAPTATRLAIRDVLL